MILGVKGLKNKAFVFGENREIREQFWAKNRVYIEDFLNEKNRPSLTTYVDVKNSEEMLIINEQSQAKKQKFTLTQGQAFDVKNLLEKIVKEKYKREENFLSKNYEKNKLFSRINRQFENHRY